MDIHRIQRMGAGVYLPFQILHRVKESLVDMLECT
jgi:hypothetical protein